MSRDTDNNLFINFSLPRFYQQLFTGMVSYEVLGNRIIRKIKGAHAFRQIEPVRELSTLLLNIPIKEYQLIAQYYLYWCEHRNREYNITSLETIIEHTRTYKAQALLSRGAIEHENGRNSDALYFFTEALKASPNVSEYIAISIAIAVAKAADGFHDLALIDIEKLVPIIKHAEPRLYHDFLNSYAVELAIAGRKQEARNISSIVLRSPFAYAYPEWRETAEALQPANRSFVAFKPSRFIPRNVLLMPVVEYDENMARPVEPGRVLNIEKWKKKMGKKSNRNKKKPVDGMTEREMFFEIMNIYSSHETTDDQRHRIFEAVVSIMSEPDKPEPDDSDEA